MEKKSNADEICTHILLGFTPNIMIVELFRKLTSRLYRK